ncbi:hypothetical protein OE88DRAFT_1647781 [Heliocybe sulcata]|uniref:Uncharacterized protein n=1 Tax=Heliocybe sulcata TaxID=5364 RepID=A0A5C3MQG4_9AGAM|nr:hypothetical protein OE88DRAFT_1647781 [Heliocybe sulcata]
MRDHHPKIQRVLGLHHVRHQASGTLHRSPDYVGGVWRVSDETQTEKRGSASWCVREHGFHARMWAYCDAWEDLHGCYALTKKSSSSYENLRRSRAERQQALSETEFKAPERIYLQKGTKETSPADIYHIQVLGDKTDCNITGREFDHPEEVSGCSSGGKVGIQGTVFDAMSENLLAMRFPTSIWVTDIEQEHGVAFLQDRYSLTRCGRLPREIQAESDQYQQLLAAAQAVGSKPVRQEKTRNFNEPHTGTQRNSCTGYEVNKLPIQTVESKTSHGVLQAANLGDADTSPSAVKRL